MRVAIITNLTNGKGLERDYRLLKARLEKRGHGVVGVMFDDYAHNLGTRFDLAIFLEVCVPALFSLAPRRWLIPNPEWWYSANDTYLDQFQRVLVKTYDAWRLFGPITALGQLDVIGFVSEDRYLPDAEAEYAFLHAPGQSTVKGTDVVLEAWRRFALPYPLTLIADQRIDTSGILNVVSLARLDDATYRQAQNAHLFHLCPSRYEGWGHTIHEALSVGAIVIATDAPPMDEWAGVAYRAPVRRTYSQRLATMAEADPAGIAALVRGVVELDVALIAEQSMRAMDAYRAECAAFDAALDRELGAVQ